MIGPSFPGAPAVGGADSDSDSDDGYGVALPPDLVAARQATAGPSLPPNFSRPPPAEPDEDESDDDDDDVGPMPLPAELATGIKDNDGAAAFREREREAEKRRKEEEDRKNAKPKREEWMLVPPKEMDLLSSMDTTKLKSRTFNQSTKTKPKASSSSSSGAPNLWTETPTERAQRMEDEVLGKRKKAEISNGGGGDEDEEEADERRRKRARDARIKSQVEAHNSSHRSLSMVEAQQSSKSSEERKKEKEAPAYWDRERDMGSGARLMDEKTRGKLLQNAKELGGRFGGSSFL